MMSNMEKKMGFITPVVKQVNEEGQEISALIHTMNGAEEISQSTENSQKAIIKTKESAEELDSDDNLMKHAFKNWIRGSMALEYFQKGLQVYVAKLASRHRDKIVQNIASSMPGQHSQCNQCTVYNLLPEHAFRNHYQCIQRTSVNCLGGRERNLRRVCPNGVCSKLYDEIVLSHRHNDPLWANTDPSTWCSDPVGWSFAKCFQTKPSPGISFEETDAEGLLSIIINDKFFQKDVACNLAAPNNEFCKARVKCNSILYRQKMELEDTELQDCLDIFVNVLQDPKRLLREPTSCEAVQNLVQLKNNEITISLSEEIKLVQIRKEALIATQAQQAQIDILEATSSVKLEKLQEKEQKVRTNLETQLQDALTKIKRHRVEKIQHLNSEIQTPKMATSVQQLQEDKHSRSKDISSCSERPNEDYRKLKTDLSKALIDFYSNKHFKIPLAPLLDMGKHTSMLEFYIMPVTTVISFENSSGGKLEKRTQISDFRSVFRRPCSDIYLTADAGCGKTSFSKRLALAWCHAKDKTTEHTKDLKLEHDKYFDTKHDSEDSQYLREDEVKTMDEFDFVFLVLLRDSKDDCHIIDMIMNQIVQELQLKNISRNDLERILYTERSLVILDGLDEWSHPENSCTRTEKAIPHRKAKQCTILTTTRPWKLRELKTSQIDRILEIGVSYTDVYGELDCGLLNAAELENLVLTEGKASPVVIKESDKICKFIKQQKSMDIVNVWPGYMLDDPDELVFVVLAKTKINLKLPWNVHIRIIGQVCEESERIMYDEENCSLSKENEIKISAVINKYSGKLMKNHIFLSVISASSVMYKKQKTGKQEIVPVPCIVLYVLVKSVVFLTEETFPEELDGIPVDVREGVFRFCAASASDRQEKLRMGCKITSSLHPAKYGTLGGFIEHPEYGLCGFTCAHVFRNKNEMFTLKCRAVLTENDLAGREFGVFQPETGDNNKIGRVVKFIYKEGTCDDAGVDAAIIKIEERAPVAGNFPDENDLTTEIIFDRSKTPELPLMYESGKVLGKLGIPLRNRKVQKFGFITGHTYGYMQFTNSVVKKIDFSFNMIDMISPGPDIQIQSTLYKQYHIKSTTEGNAFSKLGDSGALVFMEDELRDIRCIGMVVGVMESDNSVFVTPITDILREFGVEKLLSFNQNVTMTNIDHRFREIEERMQNQLKGLENKMQQGFSGLETKMQEMVQQILQRDPGERSVNETNN